MSKGTDSKGVFERNPEKLRSILNHFPQAAYISDPESLTIIYTNERFNNIFGSYHLKKKCHAILHGADKKCEFCNNIGNRIGEQKPYSWEYHSKSLGKIFEMTEKTIRFSDDKVLRLGIAIDITLRKEFEKDLINQRDISELYLEISPVMFVALDTNGTITMMNRMASQVLECDSDDMIGKNWFESFIPKNSQSIVRDIYKQIMSRESDEVEHFRNLVITAKGIERLIEWHNATINDDLGNIIGTISSGLDITEQEAAIQIIKENEKSMIIAFDNAAIGMILLNPDGTFKKVNQRYCDITGFLESEIMKKTFQDLTHPEDYDIGSDIIKRLISGEISNAIIEKRYIRKDGSTISCRFTTSLVRLSNNEPLHFSSQVEDITAQKLLNEELEHLIGQRTEELKRTVSQLVQAEKLSVLGQLSGGVGHELRNPLASIKSSTFFLKMAIENPNKDITAALEILDEEVESCEQIINSLLNFADPKLPILQKTNMNKIINDAILKVEIPDQMKLEMNLDTSIPIILADPIKLKIVFINLIRNAVQAIEKSGTISISTDNSDPSYVSIKITDTGEGISKENLEKLFTPLFTTKSKGMGLGLAISKTFIDALGGTIDVKSSLDEGTTFEIRLPVGGNQVA